MSTRPQETVSLMRFKLASSAVLIEIGSFEVIRGLSFRSPSYGLGQLPAGRHWQGSVYGRSPIAASTSLRNAMQSLYPFGQ